MRIKVKEDIENTKDTEVKKETVKINKEGERIAADALLDPLQSLTFEYLDDKYPLDDAINLSDEKNHQDDDKKHLSDDQDHTNGEKEPVSDVKDPLGDDQIQTEVRKSQSHPNSYKFQPQLTLLSNAAHLYASKIAHNLLWHIDVDETLELAKANPAALLISVEIKDPHGQRVKGTPLQIVAAAGDRNPRELKPDEKDYGLVERLRSCFPKDSKEYDKQLEEWFRLDSKKEQTNKTMAPYVNAIKTLCQEIIASKEISEDVKFDDLLKLPIVEKFRKALNPDPNHVVTSGFLFDLQIFLDFFEIWEANVNNDKVKDKSRPNLGGWDNVKSDLFAAIVYPALQARAQRIDLEVFKKGIGNVVDKGLLPAPINFSKGVPAGFSGLGVSFFFAYNGAARGGLGGRASGVCARAARACGWVGCGFESYVKQKTAAFWNHTTPAAHTELAGDNTTLARSPAAMLAGRRF